MPETTYTTSGGVRFDFPGWKTGETPLECFDRQDWLGCLHGCMLAISLYGRPSVALLEVSDDGVLHELVHLAAGVDICTHSSMDQIRDRVRGIMGLIPEE